MGDQVLIEDWTPGRLLWLRTPGRYSMDLAVVILRWIESLDRASISNPGWASPGCGNLVENGITVQFENFRLSIMCSHEDSFIKRLAGDNRKFTTMGEEVQRKLVNP